MWTIRISVTHQDYSASAPSHSLGILTPFSYLLNGSGSPQRMSWKSNKVSIGWASWSPCDGSGIFLIELFWALTSVCSGWRPFLQLPLAQGCSSPPSHVKLATRCLNFYTPSADISEVVFHDHDHHHHSELFYNQLHTPELRHGFQGQMQAWTQNHSALLIPKVISPWPLMTSL